MNKHQPIKSITLAEPIVKRNRRPIPNSQRKVALEISIKLLINGCLSVAAIAALCKILPYHFSQENKLQEVRNEVEVTEARVAQLQKDFGHNFSPAQGLTTMEESSQKVRPNQRQVFWLEEKSGHAN